MFFCIIHISIVRPVEYNIRGVFVMDYKSAGQMARRWNISQRRVQILCSENRITGAFKVGEIWVIPDNASKPVDLRKRKNSFVLSEDSNNVLM